MKRFFFILLVFCFCPIVFSQSGWNYLTLGPHAGYDFHQNTSLYNFSLRLDHFKQIKGEDIYSKYYYEGLSFNYGFDNGNISNYSLQFYYNILRKRLFEYYDRWYYKQRNMPPEKRNFIRITGLRLYPTIIAGSAYYNSSGSKSYYFRPGAGMVLNYGHLSTWNADYKLIVSYQYNLLLSGAEIQGLNDNIFSVRLGIGFKLNSQK